MRPVLAVSGQWMPSKEVMPGLAFAMAMALGVLLAGQVGGALAGSTEQRLWLFLMLGGVVLAVLRESWRATPVSGQPMRSQLLRVIAVGAAVGFPLGLFWAIWYWLLVIAGVVNIAFRLLRRALATAYRWLVRPVVRLVWLATASGIRMAVPLPVGVARSDLDDLTDHEIALECGEALLARLAAMVGVPEKEEWLATVRDVLMDETERPWQVLWALPRIVATLFIEEWRSRSGG